MRFKAICICAVICATAFCGMAAAQTSSKPGLKPDGQHIRVRVLVQDRHRHAVTDLTADNFVVTQDQAPQKLTYFGRGSDANRPLGIVLLLDTTVMNPLRIEALTHSLPATFDKLNAADSIALWTMEQGHTREIQAPTTDRQLLIDDLLDLSTKTAKVPAFGSGPVDALNAVFASRHQFAGNAELTVVLVTNDVDVQPDEKVDALRHKILQDGIGVHLLYRASAQDRLLHGLTSAVASSGHTPHVPGMHYQYLSYLARESGGEVVDVAHEDYDGALRQVLGDLATSYVLEYARPDSPIDPDALHLISVTLKHNVVKHHHGAMQLFYRKGYYDRSK